MTISSSYLYREVQRYAELLPFTILAIVGTIFGWFLVIWSVVLGRPVGALELPPVVALAIGLPLGLLLPLAYFRMQMVTEVYADRVRLINWPSGRREFRLADVREVSVRDDYIRHEYDHRRLGVDENTRIAYTVTSDKGVQLLLGDGRLVLIGSKEPALLGAAVEAAWQAAHKSN